MTLSGQTQEQTKQPFVVIKQVRPWVTHKIPWVSLEIANQKT
jgi:hypothetical protein